MLSSHIHSRAHLYNSLTKSGFISLFFCRINRILRKKNLIIMNSSIWIIKFKIIISPVDELVRNPAKHWDVVFHVLGLE